MTKFTSIHEKIVRLHGSGTSPADWLREAKELYAKQTAKKKKDGTPGKPNPFKYEEAWLVLRAQPKFIVPAVPVTITTHAVPAFDPSTTNADDALADPAVSTEAKPHRPLSPERPPGRKTAKKAKIEQAKVEKSEGLAAEIALRKVIAMEKHNVHSEQKIALEREAQSMRILMMDAGLMPDEPSKAALRARKAQIIAEMALTSPGASV